MKFYDVQFRDESDDLNLRGECFGMCYKTKMGFDEARAYCNKIAAAHGCRIIEFRDFTDWCKSGFFDASASRPGWNLIDEKNFRVYSE